MKGYVTTLRSVLFYSGDVLPDEVSAYLRRVAQSSDHELQEEVFALYRPLLDHLAAAYVDFALAVLLPRPPRHRRLGMSLNDDDEAGRRPLGFPHFRLLSPPAPVKGPFLHALRRDEDEGLRLIHGLANAAVERWHERLQRPRDGEGVTPVPTTIELPSGPRAFWGDERVYYWFRPGSAAPDAVGCALMALELWMEQEIEGGRDPEELFVKVQAGSDCVAVLGICIGIALAYPGRALRAALPLALTPALWRLEKARWMGDQQPRIPLPAFLRNEAIDSFNEERSKRPQRAVDIRGLATLYLFSGDDALRGVFREGLARFAEDDVLPIPYEEWRHEAAYVARVREEMEVYRLAADPANYEAVPSEEGVAYRFRPPAWVLEREREKEAPLAQRLGVTTLVLWSSHALNTGVLSTGVMTAEEAARLAQELEGQGGLSVQAGEEPPAEAERLVAIIGVAAALLVTDTAGDPIEEIHIWARGVVLAAARAEAGTLPGDGGNAGLAPYHLRAVAGRALCALVRGGPSDQEVREEIVRLVADRDGQVHTAAVANLAAVWVQDPALCWVAVRLAIELALEPRRPEDAFDSFEHYQARREAQERAERERVAALTTSALQRLRHGETPRPRRIPVREKSVVLSQGGMLAVIEALGASAVLASPEGRERVLQVVDDLVAWTVAHNRRRTRGERWGGSHREPHEWNRNFLIWLARLSRLLTIDETRRHILAPIHRVWRSAPQLTASFMEAFITQRLAYSGPLTDDVQQIWREVCIWVIRSPQVARLGGDVRPYRYLPSDVQESLNLVVFGVWRDTLVTAEWPHARLFIDLWDEWVESVGHYSDPYSYLLVFLARPGWSCAPEPAIRWLDEIARATSDLGALWENQGNGGHTASLLQRMWEVNELAIRSNLDSLYRFSALVDRLVGAGNSVAAVLQRALESRRDTAATRSDSQLSQR